EARRDRVVCRPRPHGRARRAARISRRPRRNPPPCRAGGARSAAAPAGRSLMPTLTAPDGTQLVYDAYEAAAPRAAVLALHGWFDHAGRWRETGEQLCAAGYSAYLLDLRGHGRSEERRVGKECRWRGCEGVE